MYLGNLNIVQRIQILYHFFFDVSFHSFIVLSESIYFAHYFFKSTLFIKK